MLKNKSKKKAQLADAEETTLKRQYHYVATFINPVDHRLYEVVNKMRTVHIIQPIPRELYETPDDRKVLSFGSGYWEEEPLEIGSSEYYRSHTPGGVAVEGAGLGLMLYSGLAVTVTDRSMDGIYSITDDRSASAERWWQAQAKRGFAEEETQYKTDYEQIELDIDEDMVKCQVGNYDCEVEVESLEPDRIYVDVGFSTSQEAQVLPATTVAEAGFTLAWNEDDFESLFAGEEQLPVEVLSELDLSTTADPALVYNILVLMQEQNASKAQIRKVLKTLPKPLQEQTLPAVLEQLEGQQRFEFEGFDTDDIREKMKRNPPKPSKAWKAYFGKLAEPIP